MKKIVLTGATSKTGYYVLKHLYNAGHEICCLVRSSSDTSKIKQFAKEIIIVNFQNVSSLKEYFIGKDYLICLTAATSRKIDLIVQACEEAQLKRAVFFSSTAIFTTLPARTKIIRTQAEEAIVSSNINYTIIRPTMIYGSLDDKNMIQLIKYVDKFPIVPIFGNGDSLQQPVFVDDIARAVCQILNTDKTIRKIYNLSGKHSLTYNEVIDIVAKILNKKILKIHLPTSLSIILVSLLSLIPFMPKFSREQVLRLNENKAFCHNNAKKDFGFDPISFEEGILKEIKEYHNTF